MLKLGEGGAYELMQIARPTDMKAARAAAEFAADTISRLGALKGDCARGHRNQPSASLRHSAASCRMSLGFHHYEKEHCAMWGYGVLAVFIVLSMTASDISRAQEVCSESHADYAWEEMGDMDFREGLRFVMCPHEDGGRIDRTKFSTLEGAKTLDPARISAAFGSFRKGVDIKCTRGGKRLEQTTYHSFLHEIVVTFAGPEMTACRAVSKSFITDDRPAKWGDEPYIVREHSCEEFQEIARARCPSPSGNPPQGS